LTDAIIYLVVVMNVFDSPDWTLEFVAQWSNYIVVKLVYFIDEATNKEALTCSCAMAGLYF
jgi:hypothetical protein